MKESVVDLSEEDIVLQPPGVPNHAAWTLGHVIHCCQAMAGELGVEPWLPRDWGSRFGYGSSPTAVVSQYSSKAANSGIDWSRPDKQDGKASVRIVDTATGDILETIPDWPATSTAFSSDGALLAYGTNLGKVVIWDVVNRREAFRLHGHNHYDTCLAFLPDDQTLLSADGHTGTVKFWDIATGQLRFELDAHEKGINLLAATPDGTMLITSGDGTATIWRAANEGEVNDLRKRWKKVDPRQ